MKAFLLTLLILIPSARADGEVTAFLKHISGDLTAGVYDFNLEEWRWQGATIAGVSGATSYIFYRTNDQPLGDSTTDNQLGQGSVWISQIGNWGPLIWPAGFLVGGLVYDKGTPERAKAFLVLEHMVESVSFTYIFTAAAKIVFNRTRPGGGNYSFPSGHTSPNFAIAGTLAYMYPWYIGVPAFAAAALVGYTRIDLNQHYASDVVAGAGIGLFFATSTYLNHLGMKTKEERLKTGVFSPLILDHTYGLTLTRQL